MHGHHSSFYLRSLLGLLLSCCALFIVQCSDEQVSEFTLADGDELRVAIMLPNGAGLGLRDAAQDLAEALQGITGAKAPARIVYGSLLSAPEPLIIAAFIEGDPRLGNEGYRLNGEDFGVPTRRGVTLKAQTEAGLMYGLYHIAKDLGVTWHHPEESFVPRSEKAELPRYTELVETPGFAMRGFHEHTQHPIEMSDFILRTDDPSFRGYVSNYLRWLARNRQNTFFFHLLKTVDFESWTPFMQDVIAEAHQRHIQVGCVFSFNDQQQNGYKLVVDEAGDTSAQIHAGLDQVMAAGFDFIELQVGASEFVAVPTSLMLGWMQVAADYMKLTYPTTKLYNWIHIYCGLKDEEGGYYYHLPLKSDPVWGSFVHTTMFYDLENPAPVYHCEDFTHQIRYMERAAGTRELVYFPESAWWLGFDNSLPFAHPLTGYSREYDIRQVLPRFPVTGHVTFTTGREWTYWQYDHFLAQMTWDRDLTWGAYLKQIAPLYGSAGQTVASFIQDWTELQRQHFYVQNPELYFYIAGDKLEDEFEISRRVKPIFRDLIRESDEEFASWKREEYDALHQMRGQYQALLDRLPTSLEDGTDLQNALYGELLESYRMYVRRIEQCIVIFDGVMACREWDLHRRAGGNDTDLRDQQKQRAEADLAQGEAITQQVLAIVADREHYYRYPLSILAEEKPESLTSYPFGYLHETRNAFFWKRRDDELRNLIGQVFAEGDPGWPIEPDLVYSCERSKVTILVPDNPLASVVLRNFLPTFLFGVKSLAPHEIHFTVDYNNNNIPDTTADGKFSGSVAGGVFSGTGPATYDLVAKDASGRELGTLTLLDPAMEAEVTTSGTDAITSVTVVRMETSVATTNLVDMVAGVGGIDPVGVENLLRNLYGIPTGDPTPVRLPLTIEFAVEAL